MLAVAAGKCRIDFCKCSGVFDFGGGVFELVCPGAEAVFVVFDRLLEHGEEPIAWGHGVEFGVDGDEDVEVFAWVLSE